MTHMSDWLTICRRSRLAGQALLGSLATAGLLAAGCQGPQGKPAVAAAQDRITALETEASQLKQRVANEQATIEGQRQQILNLQQMGGHRAVRLAPLEGIRFASLSGGYDPTGSANDQGIMLYVQPYDADGDAVKAAGELTVRMFDLGNPAGPKLIHQYTWNVEQLRKIWNGKLWTSHFSAYCPWPKDYQPPRQVTVQAEFVDALTGKTFARQQAFTVHTTEPTGR
jgi:hypothetical protein